MKNILIISFLFCIGLLLAPTYSAAQSIPNDSLSTKIKEVVSENDNVETAAEEAEHVKARRVIKNFLSFSKVFWTIVIIGLGYLTIKLMTNVLNLLAEKSTSYRITIKGFMPILKIFGWIFIIYVVVAGVFSPPAETIYAMGASLGLAVGFASQDIIKNIFGGIMILFDQPFKLGDKIEVGTHYGEVVEIGLRSTRVVTPDDSLVSIPNAEIMNHSVSNSNTGEANCQVVAEIYLPIDIDTIRVREIAIESAQVSKYIFLNKPIVALFFNEIKERKPYLKMRLKAYVMDIRDEFAFKSDMTEIVMRELIREEILSKEDFI